LAGHDRTPQGKDFAVRTNVAMITTMMTTATHRTVRMTDDRIRDEERRARRPGHRTRWPGHCAGTEATPQPRPPSSSLSPAVPLPLCPSRSLFPSLFLSLSLSFSLFLSNSVMFFHPRCGSLSLPRAVTRALFPRAAMPWSANLENPLGACVPSSLSLSLSLSLSPSFPPFPLSLCIFLSLSIFLLATQTRVSFEESK